MTATEQSQHVEAFMKSQGFERSVFGSWKKTFPGENHITFASASLATFMWRAMLSAKRDILEKLDHNKQMHGDWQQVIEDEAAGLDRLLEQVEGETK